MARVSAASQKSHFRREFILGRVIKLNLNIRRVFDSEYLRKYILPNSGITVALLRVFDLAFSFPRSHINSLSHYGKKSSIGLCLLMLATVQSALAAEPIKLHPDNPHYFLFRGKPTILISVAEHYGAVVNLDFDYIPYLDELQSHGLNLVQIFSGNLVEDEYSNRLAYNNTLAPRPGRLVVPWMRSSTPGYANGGNKFDLSKFDPAYFSRLKDFVSKAGKRGIVVEINLFWSFYRDDIWDLSPLNASNNINEVGKGDRSSAYSLSDSGLTKVQTAMVEKIVSELKDYDNVYYEVADGSTLGSSSEAWSDHMIATIVQAEATLPHPHLIAQNLSGEKVRSTNPAVSIFDAAAPNPDKVALNADLPKITAFSDLVGLGPEDKPYRVQAWELVLAGAGVFLCRDYSFTPDYEGGAPSLPPGGYGGGSLALRKQLKILKDFIDRFDFIKMTPDPSVVKGVPAGATARALVESGKAYAVYVGPKQVPSTNYSVKWTGQVEPRDSENYTFYTRSDDGVRLRINGELLIDDWNGHPVKENSAPIALKGGQKYSLELEYFQSIAGAEVSLLWSSPSQSKEIIPQNQLFRPDGSGKGLKGEYYRDLNLSQLEMTRYDNEVNFNWSGTSPFHAADNSSKTRPDLILDLPAGSYRAEWLDTVTGKPVSAEEFKHTGGSKEMALPAYSDGIVLSVKTKKPLKDADQGEKDNSI